MREGGTDLLAVACIVGGGLIAGGVTLALANGPALPSVECATTVGPEADVMVSLGNEGLVVVRPDVRVREVERCMSDAAAEEANLEAERARLAEVLAAEEARIAATVVHVRRDRRAEREQAREEIERAREEVDRVREEVDRVRERVGQVRIRRVDRAELAERVERIAAAEARGARDQARAEARRAREIARVARAEARVAREQAARERDQAALEREQVARQRDQARREGEQLRERLVERAGVAMIRRIDRAEDADRIGVEVIDGTPIEDGFSLRDGLRIALPGRTLQVRFDGLEELGEQLESGELETFDVLQLQLEALRSLRFESNEDNQEVVKEIESRIQEEILRLEERLERIRGGDEG